MVSVSAIITAAGKNSRMREDQIASNVPLKNKLTLPLKNSDGTESNVITETINHVLSCNIDQIILVLGYYSDEILESITNINEDKIKIVENNPHDVGLSVSLLNGLKNTNSDIVLCTTGDQPTVTTKTYNNILSYILKSNDPKHTISILRRRETGILKTPEGLGMPFAANRLELIKYLKSENDNLNPILRKIFADGFQFYAIEENNPLELININHLTDYKTVYDKY
jgi:molybdenum cofactor cytidylyltransferase